MEILGELTGSAFQLSRTAQFAGPSLHSSCIDKQRRYIIQAITALAATACRGTAMPVARNPLRACYLTGSVSLRSLTCKARFAIMKTCDPLALTGQGVLIKADWTGPKIKAVTG
jgi:hypothetical protein